ncbi:MAG: elongation factor P [Verrucomicrobiota bacterium]
MAKVNANDLRPGQAIKWNNDTCLVLSREHRKPGKGPAYIQAILRSMSTGKSLDERFRSSESIELVNVNREKWEFSYSDNNGYHFMNPDTFDNLTLEEDFIGKTKLYLTENTMCEIIFIEERASSVEPPNVVTLKVTDSPEGVKGDSATGATKNAEVETGLNIQVPLFINEGDMITINTETGKYTGRA